MPHLISLPMPKISMQLRPHYRAIVICWKTRSAFISRTIAQVPMLCMLFDEQQVFSENAAECVAGGSALTLRSTFIECFCLQGSAISQVIPKHCKPSHLNTHSHRFMPLPLVTPRIGRFCRRPNHARTLNSSPEASRLCPTKAFCNGESAKLCP